MQTSESIHPDKNTEKGSKTQHGRQVGTVRQVLQRSGYLELLCDGVAIVLQFVHPQILRMRVTGSLVVANTSSTAAVALTSVVPVEATLFEDEGYLQWATDFLLVKIYKERFKLEVYDVEGKLIYSLESIVSFANGQTIAQVSKFSLEHFYGLGEKTGFLDKNGEKYNMWNSDVYAPHVPEIKALYVSIPYVLHTHQNGVYALFIDNPSESVFDLQSSSDTYQIQTAVGDFDAYCITGKTMKDVISNYTVLTGKIPLPPAWSLGYHQSRYSYMNQEEVVDLAKTFREKGIPCDAIHLDIHYMNEYRVFTFDNGRFPNPQGMVRTLGEQGFHIVPIVDPGVKRDPRYEIYREGIAEDHFCKYIEGNIFYGHVWPGESAFPDFSDDLTSAWWGEKHKFYTDIGIQGIWNDMNEPAVFNTTKTMDLEVIHRNQGQPKTHFEMHNLYGMLMTRATYEGMKTLLKDQRPFILTRAGYAGVQRYAAVWTGDNRSFWEHMEMSVPMLLNMGMSGLAFAGADVGGFAHDVTAELLVRWTQLGALLPFFRNHSALDTARQEPWQFGDKVESLCKSAIQLRYQWLPYLYTLFFEASQTGIPIIRPLVLEYPEDPNVTNLSDQFLLGKDILVAPIFRPSMYKRLVYLPKGRWVNYWSMEECEGEAYRVVDAPLEIMPIFIRKGAILPEHPVAQSVSFQNVETLSFAIYGVPLDQPYRYTLYEDDGVSYNHLQGGSNLFEVSLEPVSVNQARLSYRYLQYGYQVSYSSRVFKFKTLKTPERFVVRGMKRVEFAELAHSEQGYALNSSKNEVWVKLSADLSAAVLELEWGEG